MNKKCLELCTPKNRLEHTINYVDIDGIKIQSGNRVLDKRINRFYTKEPKTLEWISRFDPNSFLVDIGACIGQYSIYAASKGHSVVAFEPQGLNYAETITNIYLNDTDNVTAYCAAITNNPRIDTLHLLSMVPGQSHNDFGEALGDNKPKQGCIGLSLDKLIEDKVIQQPDYIKIDVDGNEPDVISACINALDNCKEALIEIVDDKDLEPILDLGLKIDKKMTYKLSQNETNYVLKH